jgi:hypothetical protein
MVLFVALRVTESKRNRLAFGLSITQIDSVGKKLFVVYPGNDSKLTAKSIESSASSADVDAAVGGVNWFGAKANSPAEAIAMARASNFTPRSAEEMDVLRRKVNALRSESEGAQPASSFNLGNAVTE